MRDARSRRWWGSRGRRGWGAKGSFELEDHIHELVLLHGWLEQ